MVFNCGSDSRVSDPPETDRVMCGAYPLNIRKSEKQVGMQYYSWEYQELIPYLKEYFQWDKVSLLSHSIASLASFEYVSSHSDQVEFYIAIDILVPNNYDRNLVASSNPALLKPPKKQNLVDNEPPAYLWEEIIQIWHMATGKSVDLKNVPFLLKRGSRTSIKDSNKYYFTRDHRLKHSGINPIDKNEVEMMVMKLKCPTLYVKATNSPFGTDEYSKEIIGRIERNNENFECKFLPGTHHIHLNNPEIVLAAIMSFLTKHICF